MSVDLDTQELEAATLELSRDLARRAADLWFARSQDILAQADSEQTDSNLFPILQSGQPPVFDPSIGRYGAFVFSYTHLATIFHEYGTEPHVIRARRAEFLAFEWPDAPRWVQEQFSDTFPLVFFKQVNHPGVPAIRFIRGGRDEAQRLVEAEA